MRATIEHAQYDDILGKHRGYRVSFGVLFSEEEKAIIQARHVAERFFIVPAAEPLATPTSFVSVGVLKAIAPLIYVGGLIIGLTSPFTHFGSGLGGFLFFAGVALHIYLVFAARKQDKRLKNPDQIIRVGDLLAQAKFHVHVSDPQRAKIVEDDIRDNLAKIKRLFEDSVTITAKQTFEL